MAQALYELSIHLRPLDTVIGQIRSFKSLAPLARYQHRELIDLLRASVKCPPETEFLLLAVAAKMIKLNNFPDSSQRRELYDITRALLQERPRLRLYDGDQARCRTKLKKMLALFASQHKFTPRTKRQFKTKDIEKIVAEQQRRTTTGEDLLHDSQATAFLDGHLSSPPADPLQTATDVNLLDEDAAKFLLQLVDDAGTEADDSGSPLRGKSVTDSSVRSLSSPEKAFDDDDSPDKSRKSGVGDDGGVTLASLTPEHQLVLRDMALWFVDWNTAYQAARRVWEVVKQDAMFPLSVFISLVELTFADFLIEVLRDCAAAAGIDSEE
jgi:hypothetical protein